MVLLTVKNEVVVVVMEVQDYIERLAMVIEAFIQSIGVWFSQHLGCGPPDLCYSIFDTLLWPNLLFRTL